MKFSSFISFVFIATIFASGKSDSLNCRFYINGGSYTCDIRGTVNDGNDDVEIIGDHLPGKTNNDVVTVTNDNFDFSMNYFPSSITRTFVNLKTLQISGVDVHVISDRAFESCNELTTIVLRQVNISSIPDNVFMNCKKLIGLVLEGNQISYINERAFNGLESLKILDLDENRLSRINETIFQSCPNIENLYLRSNNLSVIFSDVLSDLKLINLDLRNNLLNIFTLSWIEKSVDLATFDISSNGLAVFEFQALKNFKEITRFSISNNNGLAMVPDDAFHGLTKLKFLSLSKVFLNGISQEFFKDNLALKSIELDGNRISSIDIQAFADLKELEVLNLNDNMIRVLPKFENMGMLKNLQLENNGIETLNAGTFHLENLERLHLSGNRIIRLNSNAFERLEKLGALILRNNRIDEIERGFFENFPNLKTLSLSSNVCTDFYTNDFGERNIQSLEECFQNWDTPRTPSTPSATVPSTSETTTPDSAYVALVSFKVLIFLAFVIYLL